MAWTTQAMFGESINTTVSGGATADECYASGTAAERETTTVTGAWSGAAYKFNCNSAGKGQTVTEINAAGVRPTATSTQRCAIFAVRMDDTTPADYVTIFTFTPVSSSGTYVSQLVHYTDGDLELWDTAGTVRATATTPFTVNTFHYLRVAVEYDSGADSLRWRVWKWGSSDPADGSGWGATIIDYTEATSGVTTGILYFAVGATANPKGSAPNTIYYVDDGIIGTFTADVDLPLAPVKVSILRPSATGTNSDYVTGSGAGSHPDPTLVDDSPESDTTDYDSTTVGAAIKTQTYNIPDTITINHSDRAVVAIGARVNVTSVAAQHRLAYVESGTTGNSGVNFSGAGTSCGMYAMDAPPVSGGAWTTTILNGLEIGMRKGSLGGSSQLLYYCFALVGIYTSHSLPLRRQPPLYVGR